MSPPRAPSLHQAIECYRRGRRAEAAEICQAVLGEDGGNFDALHLLGIIKFQARDIAEALRLLAAAVAAQPNSAAALTNLGLVLQASNRHEDALAHYERALSLQAGVPEILFNRGNVLHALNRPREALESYDRALALRPHYADALTNRGNVLLALNRPEEALQSHDRALALRPDYPEALNNRGAALAQLNRPEQAAESYNRALALRPNDAGARSNLGNALKRLGRMAEALASYDRAIELDANFSDAWFNRADLLKELGRHREAIESYRRALALNPDQPYALSDAADARLAICDWTRWAEWSGELLRQAGAGRALVRPFTFLSFGAEPAAQLLCAQRYLADQIPVLPPPMSNGIRRGGGKLRIAYVSADFRAHATSYLLARLIEIHDRKDFHVIGVSLGRSDTSAMRMRLIRAFDEFHDVDFMSDREAAALIHERRTDIAIDLKGYTKNARIGIFSHRPAPIQASFLGYPGTTGAGFIDYIVADRIVLPLDRQPFVSESIVHLPDSYQVNDSGRIVAAANPTRAEAGLPPEGFVFCCFNNSYKITPPIFDIWARLLAAVDGSVLWLLHDNADAADNLRREAAARHVDPRRLVFARRLPVEEHLARHRLADLALDTLPVNAHTTAADALWAGLPIVTCIGDSFAGRVCASLLHAVNVSELISGSLGDYEALALKLATDPQALARLRRKLAQNRPSCPLFDTDRFRRHIEAAYRTMWDIRQRGERPRSFSIDVGADG